VIDTEDILVKICSYITSKAGSRKSKKKRETWRVLYGS